MPKCVIFSERAFVSILVETREKIYTETGGVFLGRRDGDVWYIIESIDPGPKSIFETTYFEYDREYIDHLINKVSRLYSPQLDLIGLWHRHPGSFDSFSSTDDDTNTQYAELDANGAISALVNIDPRFRLTVYAVSLPLKYKKIRYVVGDSYIPVAFRRLQNNGTLQNQISKPFLAPVAEDSFSIKSFATKKVRSKRNFVSTPCEVPKRFSLHEAVCSFVKQRSHHGGTAPLFRAEAASENDMVSILEAIDTDLLFLKQFGIECEMSVSPDGALSLKEIATPNFPWPQFDVVFGIEKEQIILNLNELSYKYYPGLFKDAYIEMLMEEGDKR